MSNSTRDDSIALFTHKFSAFALRVQLALVEKGNPFNAVIVDLSDKPKELLEANPVYGKVPTLVHNGTIVLKSLIILEYLDEAFPDTAPLLPKDPLARSKCRFLADYIYKSAANLFVGVMAAPGSSEREARVGVYCKYVRTLEAAISGFSKDGPFFCGEDFGYLDVVMAAHLSWYLVYEKAGFILPDDVPRLKLYRQALSERKSVKEILPTREALVEYCIEVRGIKL